MELDDFKTLWLENDRKLGQVVRVNMRAAMTLMRAERALRWHSRSLLVELILGILALLVIGSFIGDHLREPRFLVPAVLLHLAAIASTGACVRQLLLLHEIDYAAPVLDIQRRVERMRIERIRITQATFVAAPLLWTPLLIVAMKGLLGLDAWAIFDTAWMIANVLFGAAFLIAMVLLARHYANREGGSPRLQRLMDDLADRSLQQARRSLEEVARFEDDDRDAR